VILLNRRSSTALLPLFMIIVLLTGLMGISSVFATFCQVSNLTYNYPRQVISGQSFDIAISASGVCASDDANYHSMRADVNDISGRVLSNVSVPIGYSQGQNWTVTLTNHVAAPTDVGSWQILFVAYVFAAIGSGDTMDSTTIRSVTIQVGTPSTPQTVTSVALNDGTSGIAVASASVPLAVSTANWPIQNVGSGQ
jgi:hypothetical protein